jgi:hypothetical protein
MRAAKPSCQEKSHQPTEHSRNREGDDFDSVDLDAGLLRQQLVSTDRIELSVKSRESSSPRIIQPPGVKIFQHHCWVDLG